jgi:hypothetical protein
MGIEDRDWYHEERLNRLNKAYGFKKAVQPGGWLRVIVFWAALAFFLFQISKYFLPPNPALRMPQAERPAGTPLSANPPPIVEGPESRSQTYPVKAERQVPSPAQTPAAQVARSSAQGSDTIYRCRAYSGGAFWSSAYCETQQALVDRIVTVPSGMPFGQQVQIAEAQYAEVSALINQQPSVAAQIADRCAALKSERDTIEGRYSKGQWQPPEVVNPDQTRMRGLRAEQARLGCPTQ